MGYNFIIPTFQDVGAKEVTYNLDNVKLIGARGDGVEKIIVYTDEATLDGRVYYYYTELGYGPEEGEGWYDDNDVKIKTVNMPLGTGLYLNCPTEGVQVQYAGQVYDGAFSRILPIVGYNMIGNATPLRINLQDIKLIGARGDGVEKIIVYTDEATLDGRVYYYYTELGYGPEQGEGWYDDNDVKVNVPLLPGEGLYLNCPTEGVEYQLPDPLNYTYTYPEIED